MTVQVTNGNSAQHYLATVLLPTNLLLPFFTSALCS